MILIAEAEIFEHAHGSLEEMEMANASVKAAFIDHMFETICLHINSPTLSVSSSNHQISFLKEFNFCSLLICLPDFCYQ